MSRHRVCCGLLNPRNRIEQEERRNGGKQKHSGLIPVSRHLSLRFSVPLVQSVFSTSFADCS